MKVLGLGLILSALLPVLLVEAKPSSRAYDIPDIDDDIMPPAPRGEPFQETETDAMTYILDDNDPLEQEIIDGDIPPVIVDGDIYEPVHNESSRSKRNAVKGRNYLWPGGLVPYVISPYFHTDSKLAVLSAMQRFHDRTCIRFRPRTIERDFIYIGPGRGCWSLVGRQGSRQSVSLGATCKTKRGTIMHELMHVLGFRHEHNRPDRDAHVIIYWDNIAKSMEMNFKKYPYGSVDLLGVQYDFGSIMHYPMYAFSKSGAATLSPRYTTYQEIGFRNDFSDLDVYRINTLYKCGACQDTDHNHCPTWAMGGSCDRNRNWMSKNCAFSCRMCKTNSHGACQDTHDSCKAWAKVGECRRNPPWMKKTCPLSCGGCPMDIRNRQDEITGCHDKNTLCYDWALIGECHANKGYMSKICRLSCSFCDDEEIQLMGRGNQDCFDKHETKECKRWAWQGECLSNPEGTRKICRKSCGQCGEREGCQDLNRRCVRWAKAGECTNKPSIKFMKKFCGPSCGFCTPSAEEIQESKNVIGSEQGATKNKKRVKAQATITTVAPTTATTTTAVAEPTEPQKKSKKKNKKNKKSKKNKKNKKKTKPGRTETRQLLIPDDLGETRPASREVPNRKLKRMRKRLEKAQAMSRAMEEKRALKLVANSTLTETEAVNIDTQEQITQVDTQVQPIQEPTKMLHEQMNPIDKEEMTVTDDQTNDIAQNSTQTTGTL